MKSRLNILRTLQLIWAYFIGIGALVGFLMMIYDPTGKAFQMDPLLPMLRNAFPFVAGLFNNFICSAFVLLTVNGLTNAVSIVLMHKHNKYEALSALACGIILMLWISVEFYVWGFAALSIIYGIFALLQILNALLFIKEKSLSFEK